MQLSISVFLAITIFYVIGFHIGLWAIFKKAGKNPWFSIIPFYYSWAWIEILEKPRWWFIFCLIPYVHFFMLLLMYWKTMRCFHKTSYLFLIPGIFLYPVYAIYLGFFEKVSFVTPSQLPKFKKSAARDWMDAILFAVAAAYIVRTFLFELYTIPTSSMESSLMVGDYLIVDKTSYGSRIPKTPIAVPFVHHTLPLSNITKSYVEWLKFPYMRLPKLTNVQRNDVVVFNYADGDTVVLERQAESYYAILRNYEKNYGAQGHEKLHEEYQITARPLDKRDNYVKRCVAIPGDVLQVINSQLYINGKPAQNPQRIQTSYIVTSETSLSKRKLNDLNINLEDVHNLENIQGNFYLMNLTEQQAQKIKKISTTVSPHIMSENNFDPDIFPHDQRYLWNRDNFGPITIPKAGTTVALNDSTIVLYRRIIKIYENNDLEEKDGKIYINQKEINHYTFKQNYYFMMGDNRHNSADSRFWGFVPEDHIVGKPVFVWLSLNKHKSLGDGKIRWDRMFRTVKQK